MPYIKDVNNIRELLVGRNTSPLSSGELNYKITTVIDRYVMEKGKNYQTLNEVIGVLECAKLELYRRIVALYEDTKIAENGDVYTIL